MGWVRNDRLKIVSVRLFTLIALALSISACSKVGQFKTQAPLSGLDQGSQHLPGVSPVPSTPPVVDPPAQGYISSPLLWEKVTPDGAKWSSFVYSLFKTSLKDSVNAADDMVRFCPRFAALSLDQKVNTWGMLISAMAKYESNFSPTSRMKETTMGTDPVTGLPVYSEGLLQLSYQDITGWSFCNFDWSKDKYLAANDPKKTILDPIKNLDCGARILAEQVTRHHKIAIDQSAYWAVIKQNGRYEKLNEIASLVQTLPFCKSASK